MLEWPVVKTFFAIALLFALGASIARSIGMTLLVHYLGGDILPQVFMLIDFSAMLGFFVYAHYTKKYSEIKILRFLFLAVLLFCGLLVLLFASQLPWVYGWFFIGFLFFYILISIHFGSVLAAYFTPVQLKRLTGVILAGLPIGGVLGGALLGFSLRWIEPQQLPWLVLLSMVAYSLAIVLLKKVNYFNSIRSSLEHKSQNKSLRSEWYAGWHYLIHSKLMIYMAASLLLFVVASKLLEYQYQAMIYPQQYPDAHQRAHFFAFYDMLANSLWLVFPLATFMASSSLLLLKEHFNSVDLATVLPRIGFGLSLLAVILVLPQWRAYNSGVFRLLKRNFIPDYQQQNQDFEEQLCRSLRHNDPQQVRLALDLMQSFGLTQCLPQVLHLLKTCKQIDIKHLCINTLLVLSPKTHAIDYLINALKIEHQSHTQALLLNKLAQFRHYSAEQIALIETFLWHPAPAVFCAACLCLYPCPNYPQQSALLRRLLLRLNHPKLPQFALYLQTLGDLRQTQYSHLVLPFLNHPQADIQLAAFKAHINLLQGQLNPYKERFLTALTSQHKEMKMAALDALKACSPPRKWQAVIGLLGSKDRLLCDKSKALLWLNLKSAKGALFKRVLDEYTPTSERLQALSIVYPVLNGQQRQRLSASGEHWLQNFLISQALLYLFENQSMGQRYSADVRALLIRILHESQQHYLLAMLTLITHFNQENRDFFQRVSQSLQSNNRAIQGNGLEVLSNMRHSPLAQKLVWFYESKINDFADIATLYARITKTPLGLTLDNYRQYLLDLNNDFLHATLYYDTIQRHGYLSLRQTLQYMPLKVQQLLGAN